MDESTWPTLNLSDTFGALLIGVFVSAVLLGVTCTQVFYYYQTYTSDGILIKGTVFTLLILEALRNAFSMHAIYKYTILDYSNPKGLLAASWTAIMTVGISGAIVFVVHLFYVRRIYHISKKNIPLVILLSMLSLAHFGTSLEVTIRSFHMKFFAILESSKDIENVDAVLALAVATDLIIAGSLSFYLHTSRSGVGSTNTLINKLITHAVNNGVLTSVASIVILILAATEVNLIFFAIFQIVGSLYTNPMMANLNSRQSLDKACHPVLSMSSQATQAIAFKVQGPSLTSTTQSEDSRFNVENKGVGIV